MRHKKGRPTGNGAALTTAGEAVVTIVPADVGQRGRRRPVFAPSPGGILAAAEAVHGRDTYTREQVAYLVALAYRSGRVHGAAEDIAEDVACWREYAAPAPTREQRVAERMTSMRGTTPPPPLRLDDPDWPPVAVPGTVDVAELRRMRAAA